MVYGIIRGELAVSKEYFLTENKTLTTNNNGAKLKYSQSRYDIDKCAFGQKSVLEWNRLPAQLANAESTERFRKFSKDYLSSSSSSDYFLPMTTHYV